LKNAGLPTCKDRKSAITQKVLSTFLGPTRAAQARNMWAHEQEERKLGYYQDELREMSEKNISMNDINSRMKLRTGKYEDETSLEQKKRYIQDAQINKWSKKIERCIILLILILSL
jgi:hypothetical protein